MPSFPRTEVAGVSLPRMLIGSNWVLGYSHTSASADRMIREKYAAAESVAALVSAYLAYDIDAMMAPFVGQAALNDGIRMAEDRLGKGIVKIDTPVLNMEDTKEGRAEARATVEACKKNGATFCLIHHSSAEKLVDKCAGTMKRLPDYTDMIRQAGLIPGLSAHMPELIAYSDANGYDVETYIQLYNCMGFLMQVEVESVHRTVWNAKKPVMTIKPMAAGRCSPFVGITFSFATLRPCDMVTVGAHTPDEAYEDIEIGLAAIERRRPDVEGRGSPNLTVALGGVK